MLRNGFTLLAISILIASHASPRGDHLALTPCPGCEVSEQFRSRGHLAGEKVWKLLLNGRDTGIRVPDRRRIEVVGRDKKGSLYGNLHEFFDGAYIGERDLAFWVTHHRVRLFPPPEGFSDSKFVGVDRAGRAVGLWGFSSLIPDIDHPFDRISHGFLFEDGRAIDLGAADSVQLDRRGRGIRGTAMRDRATGRYRAFNASQETEIEHFTWRSGIRRTVSIEKIR